MINLQLLSFCHADRFALARPKKETSLPTTGLKATCRYLTVHSLALLTGFFVIVPPLPHGCPPWPVSVL